MSTTAISKDPDTTRQWQYLVVLAKNLGVQHKALQEMHLSRDTLQRWRHSKTDGEGFRDREKKVRKQAAYDLVDRLQRGEALEDMLKQAGFLPEEFRAFAVNMRNQHYLLDDAIGDLRDQHGRDAAKAAQKHQAAHRFCAYNDDMRWYVTEYGKTPYRSNREIFDEAADIGLTLNGAKLRSWSENSEFREQINAINRARKAYSVEQKLRETGHVATLQSREQHWAGVEDKYRS